MQLVRKGSNVEIEVSQCESEPIDDDVEEGNNGQILNQEEDSIELPN